MRPQGLLALLLVIAASACGRTELDLIPDDGSAGVGGAGGAAGRGGAGGVSGSGGQMPVPVTCGQTICVPGTQTCCIQANTQTCIPVQAPCAGASFSCLDGAACTGGNVCCLSLAGSSASCTTQQLCSPAAGVVLCASDAHCPSTAPRCCRIGASGVCSTQSCP